MPGLTLSSPITTARGILNDPNAVRYSADDLLQYANDALDQIALLKPDLFYTDGELGCVAGKTLQTVPATEALSLVGIKRIKGGNAVTRTDKDTLEAFNPGWHLATAGPAKHWMSVDNDPLRFHIYPAAPVNQVLELSYVRVPAEYSGTQDTELPTTLSDAIADYIVYRAESRDDEHVNSNRAAQYLASFVQKVKG